MGLLTPLTCKAEKEKKRLDLLPLRLIYSLYIYIYIYNGPSNMHYGESTNLKLCMLIKGKVKLTKKKAWALFFKNKKKIDNK